MNPQHPQNATVADAFSFKAGAWLVRWNPETEQWQGQHERRGGQPVLGAEAILTAMLHVAQVRRQEGRS